MSNQMIGMNPDEVEDLAQFLRGRGGELREVVQRVDWLIGRTYWVGPTSERFKHQWWPEHRARLLDAAERVEGLGRSAANNASEQRAVSRAGGSGGASGGGWSGAGGGWKPSVSSGANQMIPWVGGALTLTSLSSLVVHGYEPAKAAVADGANWIGGFGAAAEGAKGLSKFGLLGVVGVGVGVADTAMKAEKYGATDIRTLHSGFNVAGGVAAKVVAGPAGAVAWTVSTKGTEWAMGELDNRYDIHQRNVDQVIARTGEIPDYDGFSGFGRFARDSSLNVVDSLTGGLRGLLR